MASRKRATGSTDAGSHPHRYQITMKDEEQSPHASDDESDSDFKPESLPRPAPPKRPKFKRVRKYTSCVSGPGLMHLPSRRRLRTS